MVERPGGGDPIAAKRNGRKTGHAHGGVAFCRCSRAHRHAVRAVPFGDITLGEHQCLGGGVGGEAMIAVGALVPQPIDRRGSGRAGAGRGVRQRNVERARRFVDEAAVIRVGRDLRQNCRTFRGRRGEEMRIGRWRNVEPAHRIDARAAARRVGECLEREPGARPAEEMPRIEGLNIGLQRRDEVVVERRVVVLDDRDRLCGGGCYRRSQHQCDRNRATAAQRAGHKVGPGIRWRGA